MDSKQLEIHRIIVTAGPVQRTYWKAGERIFNCPKDAELYAAVYAMNINDIQNEFSHDHCVLLMKRA